MPVLIDPTELESGGPVVAGGELFGGRPDLPARQPFVARASSARAHQTAAAGALGHDTRV